MIHGPNPTCRSLLGRCRLRQAHTIPPKLRAGIPISSPPPPASQFLAPRRPVSIPLPIPNPISQFRRLEPRPPPCLFPPPISTRAAPALLNLIDATQATNLHAAEEARRCRLQEAAGLAAVAARQVQYPPLLRETDPGLPDGQAAEPRSRPRAASPSTSAACRGGAVGGLAGGHQDAGPEAGQVFSGNGECFLTLRMVWFGHRSSCGSDGLIRFVWCWLACAVQLIKQSQDDGGAEVVTWKISPVNDRLRAMKSGPFPRTVLHPCPNKEEVHQYRNSFAYILTCSCAPQMALRVCFSMRTCGVVDEITNLLWVSDFSITFMAEKFLPRGYEEMAFISVGLVKMYFCGT
jgi:hypothetical protein